MSVGSRIESPGADPRVKPEDDNFQAGDDNW